MNAPVKLTLDDLHKQRADLLKKRDGIAEAREKLSLVDQEAEAKAALLHFTDAAANAVEIWASSGCRGPRAGADVARHAELESANFRAQHALRTADSATNSLVAVICVTPRAASQSKNSTAARAYSADRRRDPTPINIANGS